MKSTLQPFAGLYRAKRAPRLTIRLDLAAVRKEAVARAAAEGRELAPGDLERLIVAAIRDDDALDPTTRMATALALAEERLNERRSAD